jgi:hypothetical protein
MFAKAIGGLFKLLSSLRIGLAGKKSFPGIKNKSESAFLTRKDHGGLLPTVALPRTSGPLSSLT